MEQMYPGYGRRHTMAEWATRVFGTPSARAGKMETSIPIVPAIGWKGHPFARCVYERGCGACVAGGAVYVNAPDFCHALVDEGKGLVRCGRTEAWHQYEEVTGVGDTERSFVSLESGEVV